MSQESMIDLFNRWEQVWHEGKFDLVPSCVTGTYTRHDQKGIARYPAKHTQRKSPRCVSNALVSELLYTITPGAAYLPESVPAMLDCTQLIQRTDASQK